MTPFPWAEAMRLGLGVLRLPSREFWAMTPREFMAAVSGLARPIDNARPMDRTRFEQLAQRFPDTERKSG